MRARALVLTLLLPVLLTACGQVAFSEHERPYPTIVSLNPCSDAILAEMAGPDQLLAISHYSHDPAASSMDADAAAQFAAVSGSAEEVLALRPDVVVADPFLPPATRAALAQGGVEVMTLPLAQTVGESRLQVLALAQLTGDEDAGIRLNADIDAALARAAAPRDNPRIPAIVWQAGGIVPGRDTLVADLLAHTGFVLQSAARGMRQADVLPLEEILADPPRVLLVAGDTRGGENRMLDHPVLAYLPATRRAAFEPSLLWCGGPTIARAARRLAEVRKSL